jgi:hypothetical protein
MSEVEQENPERGEFRESPSSHPVDWNRWWLVAVLMLFAATGASMIYAVRQHGAALRLAQANDQMAVTLRSTQAQISSLSDQVMALKAQAYSRPPVLSANHAKQLSRDASGGAKGETIYHRVARRFRRHPTPSRYDLLQKQIAKQGQQLSATQQAIAQTRSDLENSLSSTRDDLNNSIAHNHGELVAMERKGERNYYEFSIVKSKHFVREGPVSLSLRHTNTKHKNYNMVVLVDDMQLSKKNINLYEPLVLETANDSHPMEVVVNRISKNRIQGYVSAPKYSALEAPKGVESGSVAAGQQGASTSTQPTATGPTLQRRAGTD